MKRHLAIFCEFTKYQLQACMVWGERNFKNADEICIQLSFDAKGIGFNRRPHKW